MTTAYIADTGVFVRCGGPGNEKFQRLRRAVRQAGVSLIVPQRVYEELGGDPTAEAYPSGNIPYPKGFQEGWIVVADELDYTDPLVSTVMDDTRRWIANETARRGHRREGRHSADRPRRTAARCRQIRRRRPSHYRQASRERRRGAAPGAWLRGANRVPLRERGIPRNDHRQRVPVNSLAERAAADTHSQELVLRRYRDA
jgi:hypothetical protein